MISMESKFCNKQGIITSQLSTKPSYRYLAASGDCSAVLAKSRAVIDGVEFAQSLDQIIALLQTKLAINGVA
jgi:hypothetical protein